MGKKWVSFYNCNFYGHFKDILGAHYYDLKKTRPILEQFGNNFDKTNPFVGLLWATFFSYHRTPTHRLNRQAVSYGPEYISFLLG